MAFFIRTFPSGLDNNFVFAIGVKLCKLKVNKQCDAVYIQLQLEYYFVTINYLELTCK